MGGLSYCFTHITGIARKYHTADRDAPIHQSMRLWGFICRIPRVSVDTCHMACQNTETAGDSTISRRQHGEGMGLSADPGLFIEH